MGNQILDVNNYFFKFDNILKNMSEKMLIYPQNDDITMYFIACMIPNHLAAIYMCENLLQYTNDKKLVLIASNIIKRQTKGIKQMDKIAQNNIYNGNYEIMRYTDKYLQIANNMINNMKYSRYANINIDFILEMIPHHIGAIEMCNNLLNYNVDEKLKKVAVNIIKEQSINIDQLKTVYNKLIYTQ